LPARLGVRHATGSPHWGREVPWSSAPGRPFLASTASVPVAPGTGRGAAVGAATSIGIATARSGRSAARCAPPRQWPRARTAHGRYGGGPLGGAPPVTTTGIVTTLSARPSSWRLPRSASTAGGRSPQRRGGGTSVGRAICAPTGGTRPTTSLARSAGNRRCSCGDGVARASGIGGSTAASA
jgi:hypothetical protein